MPCDGLVSIVLATYNGERYLREQILSLLSQTYPNIEVVVVDDNSSDRTFEIAAEFVRANARVRLCRNPETLGIAPNFLKGVGLAKGSFVCFSDQDDRWRPDKIQVLIDLLQHDEKNMLAYSDLEICDEALGTLHSSFWNAAGIRPRLGHLREASFLRNIAPGCSIMFRRRVKEVMDRLGASAPFMHDHLAFIVASCLGRVAYTGERLVQYRQHAANNIGAFYPSIMDKEGFARDLGIKIDFISKIQSEDFKPDLGQLRRFCNCLRGQGDIFLRALFIHYYLFLRNDTVRDKFLGCMECFWPGFYRWLRDRRRLLLASGLR